MILRLLIFLLLAVFFHGSTHAVSASKYNVLFIVADDLTCALGCYGNKVVQTPHIDRLAKQGVRFDRAYCNYPVCNASRASFLSGRYPQTTGVFGNATPPRARLGSAVRFLPEHFHDQGYYTAGIGKISHGAFADSVKWDLFADAGKGEDDDLDAGALSKAQVRKAMKETGAGAPFVWLASNLKDEEEADGLTATKVAKLMEDHKGGPFFIGAGFHKPHLPHQAPKKYFDMYPPEKMAWPAEPAGHEKGIPTIARPQKYFPDYSEARRREIIAHYYACVTFMDAQVGVLLATMDKHKLWDNTVVVFMGDHGWHLGEHGGFYMKMSTMEESARTPLIVVAPGGAKGAASPRLVEFVDLYPTLVDLCGLPVPGGLEGKSFRPLMQDPAQKWKPAVYTVVTRRAGKGSDLGHSVRTEQFTYTEWPDGSKQLYDYAKDPREYVNLAGDTTYAETIASLKKLLAAGPQGAFSKK